MLIAHLVPGYFAAVYSRRQWHPEWSNRQRLFLWGAALSSTFIPDLDVIYNALFRGFINHSVLWTHSLFLHLAVGLCWWLLHSSRLWPYLKTMVGLIAVGGLSHLVLDVISHGTLLFYPVSMMMVGGVSDRIMEGGLGTYITDPLFLLEPLLIVIAGGHWLIQRKIAAKPQQSL